MSADLELVAHCLNGDESALRRLVEQYERPVYALCLRMLGHRQDAEDVAQEALTRMCRHLGSWDGSRPLLPWVLSITANRCRTALERRSRRPVPVAAVPEPSTGPTPDTTEIAEELQRALGDLREDHRHCFILFYEHELSVADIGEILQVPEGTVKTWLHRARRTLAEQLRARGYQ